MAEQPTDHGDLGGVLARTAGVIYIRRVFGYHRDPAPSASELAVKADTECGFRSVQRTSLATGLDNC